MILYNMLASYEITERQEQALRHVLKKAHKVKRYTVEQINCKQILRNELERILAEEDLLNER